MVRDVKIVTGASYGDEGKGLMTAYFCSEAGGKCLNICHNGGAQRGHTVAVGNRRHIFHHMGSGSFFGADTYFTEDFILNPMIFSEEVSELSGIPENIRLCRHPDCRWSTPYDMIANQIIEEKRWDKRHGSCGVGIWETVLRYMKTSPPTANEFLKMTESERHEFLAGVRKYFLARLAEKGIKNIPGKWYEIFYGSGTEEHFIMDMKMMTESIILADEGISEGYDRLVFEGGQGLLLSEKMAVEYGSDSHTTPSLTGYENPVKFLRKINFTGDTEVCYVTRTYLTRHGAGPFPGECDPEEIAPGLTDLTNIPNPHQGTIRYGRHDIDSLNRRISDDFSGYKDFPGAVCSAAVTHLNETGGFMAVTDGRAQISEIKADRIYMSRSENVNETEVYYR